MVSAQIARNWSSDLMDSSTVFTDLTFFLAPDNDSFLLWSVVPSSSVIAKTFYATLRVKRHSNDLSLVARPSALVPVGPGSSDNVSSAVKTAS